MRLQLFFIFIAVSFIEVESQMPDITYSAAWYILPYTPMAKLYNFVQNLNVKDKTKKQKLERAKKFISNNWGKPKVQNATFYNTKAKAQDAFAKFIKHREAVQGFWNKQLNNQLLKLFNNKEAKVKEYRKMFLQCDRTYDQDFWTAINNWYTFSHYHIAQAKRDALYDAIDTAIGNYYRQTGEKNNIIDFSIWPYPDYSDYLYSTFLEGNW